MNEPSRIIMTPGTILGETYQIIRLIGQGGMGAVYMAYDMSLDLKVAVKVISPKFVETMDTASYEGALKRFQAEARIAAKIDHANVIRIFGFKQDTITIEEQDTQIDYLVMELLAERTLRDTMDESGFEHDDEIIAWVNKYIIPILDGLEKVHSYGIIHRDIKPENFFMKGDVAKIADFGLSMGLDFPSVTGSMADIFGTLTYMAPEQFYNFSLAREPADIFSIGRILFEVVEGKMTDRVKPFKQVRISDTGTDYRKGLNDIITAATAENLGDRIGSVKELRARLLDIQKCELDKPAKQKAVQTAKLKPSIVWLMVTATILSVGSIAWHYFPDVTLNSPSNPQPSEVQVSKVDNIEYGVLPQKGLKATLRAEDNSILHLIPPITMALRPGNILGIDESKIALNAFYLSESPITNQQYVAFLNANLDKIEFVDDDVLLNKKLILKLSEKIRSYKPIIFDGEVFKVQYPMHSSCAVLMVTGYGAAAYANHFGFRVVTPREWFVIMQSGNAEKSILIPLPSPVINYEKDKYELRGINQIAEWGKTGKGEYKILGPAASAMVESELILDKDPTKYYTDTSFRVAKNLTLK